MSLSHWQVMTVRIRTIATGLLLAAALVGCSLGPDRPLTEIPEGAEFAPAGARSGFAIRGELHLYPHHELVGGGLASFIVHVESLSDEAVRDLRMAVFYPEEIALVSDVEPYLESPRGYDLTPDQPSYGLGRTFTFPDWGQAHVVRQLAEKPLRVHLVWDGGEQFLEVPPEAIRVTQSDEPRRLANDPDLFSFPTHPAFLDHLPFSEGRYLSRARDVTAADLLAWYRAEMPASGWEALPAPDRALLFRKGEMFLSLAAADEPDGTAVMWSHLRGTAEVPEDAAVRIVRARYPESRENQWVATYLADGAGSGADSPVWEVRGLRDGKVWVTAWVDAVTAELRVAE